ncbi:hypothetical protein DF186_19340, partial [Enterococcus hirae]
APPPLTAKSKDEKNPLRSETHPDSDELFIDYNTNVETPHEEEPIHKKRRPTPLQIFSPKKKNNVWFRQMIM